MFRQTIITTLLFIMLFSLIGIAYAVWSDTLKINTSVGMGELDWEFSPGSVIQLDTCAYPVPDYNASYFPSTGSIQTNKDVGCTELILIDSDGDGDYDTLNVTMYNVYPWYYEHIAFALHNDGTIPLKVWRAIINGNIYYEIDVLDLDLNGDGKPDLHIWWGNNFGAQIDPCNSADLSFDLTVLQDAPENSTLSFTISLEAIQWNEYYVP